MCRPPTRHRRPTLLAATAVVAFAASAGAEPAELPTSRAQTDAARAAVDPSAFASSSQDGSAPAERRDAGAAPDGPEAWTSRDADAEAASKAGSASLPLAEEASPPDEERPAFLHLAVNQVDVDDVFVILRGPDVLAKVGDLGKTGLRVVGGTREKRGEDEMVWLRSLAPRVEFAVDERALTLTVTAEPSLFGGVVLDLRSRRPEGIVYGSAPSLFANYSVTGSDLQDGRGARASGFAEAGLSLGGHLLFASGQRNAIDGSWDRLMTNLIFDVRHRLTRIVVGDFTATSDVLGSGRTLGGVSVTRDYSLDPYYVFLPTQRLSGTALTPSTVEVYVNGQLVRRESLPPGQFDLQNIPTTSGSGETRVVIKDAFGAAQTVASPYYMALGTLAKGLSDFGYNLGFARLGLGDQSWNYGRPEMILRHRYGLTDGLTLGGRFEGTLQARRGEPTLYTASGGPSLALRLPVGELAVIAAASRQDGRNGGAALLSYSYVGRPVYLQVGARYQSRDYANLSALVRQQLDVTSANGWAVYKLTHSPVIDRQRLDVTTSVAKNISQVASASIQYQATDWWHSGWNHRLTLMGNRTLTRWMYVFATFGALFRTGMPAEYDLFAGISFAAADRVSASATRSDHWGGGRPHGGATQAALQQSLPVGPGLGYRVVATQGENALNQATLQYQGAYGRVEADYQRYGFTTPERGQARLSVLGGIVLIGGRLFLTRQNQDAYALIRVPSVAGVHATVSNQAVGTTDGHGDLLIPNLLHYYGNRVGINDKDIPIDYDIGATEETIAPPYRGGMIVAFPVRRVQSVAGTVVIEEKDAVIVPAYGQIVVSVGKRQVISPLDEAGNFYLEDLAPGAYMAEVQYAAGACRLPLVVKAGATSLVNVGTLACIQSAASESKVK